MNRSEMFIGIDVKVMALDTKDGGIDLAVIRYMPRGGLYEWAEALRADGTWHQFDPYSVIEDNNRVVHIPKEEL